MFKYINYLYKKNNSTETVIVTFSNDVQNFCNLPSCGVTWGLIYYEQYFYGKMYI